MNIKRFDEIIFDTISNTTLKIFLNMSKLLKTILKQSNKSKR